MTNLAEQHGKSKRHTKDSGKNLRVPVLRLHKASGRAYVVLNGKAVYLGRHGDPEVKQSDNAAAQLKKDNQKDKDKIQKKSA